MTFEDLRASNYKPFPDFVSVKRAKELSLIPEKYSSIFDNHCSCGSERMVRIAKTGGSITGVTCCNPYCTVKMIYQLNEIFERFKYKGIGPAICANVVSAFQKKYESFTIADILIKSTEYNTLSGAEEIEWDKAVNSLHDSRQTLGTLVYKLGYPGIGSKFEEVLQGISTTDQLTQIILKEGFLKFFSSRGVKSLTTIYYFVTYLPEIFTLIEHFKDTIIISSDKVISVCMTGKMETSLGRFTKEQYIQQCLKFIEKRDFKQNFELKEVKSVSQATFIVVGRDSVAGNRAKYRAALEKQDRLRLSTRDSELKIVLTPDEFFGLALGKREVYNGTK